MYKLKAYRGPAIFEQTFTSFPLYQEKRSWLVANGFTIGTPNAGEFLKIH